MSRYRGPRIRIIRRLNQSEKLRGFTRKQTFRKKTVGEHGKIRPKKYQQKKNSSGKKKILRKIPKYRLRLQEKQKLRFNYGLTESQLIKYIKQAKKKRVNRRNAFTIFRNAT